MFDDEPRSELVTEKFYKDYLACPWPGEAAMLPSPDPDKFVIIFTDRDSAGGVVSVAGMDWDLASEISLHFQERAEADAPVGDVFDRIRYDFGVEEVWELDDLTVLGDLPRDW
ncbi:hypothetical protein [Corynebacterium atrinae]